MNIGSPYATLGGINAKIYGNAGTAASSPSSSAASYTGWGSNLGFLGQPFVFYLGMIAFLFLVKWFSEHPNTPINPMHLHIGGYNFVAVGVTATLFIVTMKLLLARYPVMGLSQVINYA